MTKQVLARIDALIAKGELVVQTARPNQNASRSRRSMLSSEVTSASYVELANWTEWRSQSLNLLDQVVGESSTYRRHFDDFSQGPTVGSVNGGLGVLRAVREDVAAGHLAKLSELVRADVFSDFLEMAEHLLKSGYKDPAAVLIGGVLEEHLRLLCKKHGIPSVVGSKPKNADAMNAELAKAGVYDTNRQKIVLAWLALRNSAAHADYGKYSDGDVDRFASGLREFIAAFPA